MRVRLPPHLRARLHAASTVLGTTPEALIEELLEAHLDTLDETRRELVDRFASETLVRTED